MRRHASVPTRPYPAVSIPSFRNGFGAFVSKNSQRSVNNLCVALWNAETLVFSGEDGGGAGRVSRSDMNAVLTHRHLSQTRQSRSAEQRYILLRSVLAEYWQIMAHDEHNKKLDLKNSFCQCVYLLQKHNSINLQCVVCSGGGSFSMLCSTKNGDWRN